MRQKSGRSASVAALMRPANIGTRSRPSKFAGTSVRAAVSTVAVRSIVMPGVFAVRPAGSTDGHQKMAGTRMPPSQSVSLR